MQTATVPKQEHELRVLLAGMENQCLNQRVLFIGDPWEVWNKANELKRIINQTPQPNSRINKYEGD